MNICLKKSHFREGKKKTIYIYLEEHAKDALTLACKVCNGGVGYLCLCSFISHGEQTLQRISNEVYLNFLIIHWVLSLAYALQPWCVSFRYFMSHIYSPNALTIAILWYFCCAYSLWARGHGYAIWLSNAMRSVRRRFRRR